MAEHDDALRRHPAFFTQVPVCGIGITVQAVLAKSGVMRRPVELRQIARVAMADQQPERAGAVGSRHDPAHQLHTIFGAELSTFDWKLERRWWWSEATLRTREIDQAGFGKPQHHDEREVEQDHASDQPRHSAPPARTW